MMVRKVTGEQARQLLHNKVVVVLGASVQRGMYKDLVHLLQHDDYLELKQLRTKGELCFEGDTLVEGGRLGPMHNGTAYTEVRQFRTDHHLVRFYFLTRIYSPYMLSVLEDFRRGPPPDVIFVNSCLWDISRYPGNRLEEYRENLQKFFTAVKDCVSQDCLMVWLLSMPLGDNIRGGFLVPEVQHLGPTLRFDVIEANFDAAQLAAANGLDVLDLHYNFRLSLQHRMDDNTHWNQVAHRCISWLLLRHVAEAWGVDLWGAGDSGPPVSLGQWTPDPQMCDNWATGDDGVGEGPRSAGGIQQLTYNRQDFGAHHSGGPLAASYATLQQNPHNPVPAACQRVDRHAVRSEQECAPRNEPPGPSPPTVYQALLDLVHVVRENKGSTSSSSKGKKRRAKAAHPGGQPEDCSSTAAVVPQLDFTSDEGYSENSVPSWQYGARGNVRHASAPQNAGADFRQPLSREVTVTSHQHVVLRRRHLAQHPARVHPYHHHHRPSSHHHNPYSW